MKSTLKKIFVYLFYYSTLNWLVGRGLEDKIFCVGYHSIWDKKNEDQLQRKLYPNIAVNIHDFEKQLVWMKENGHTFIHFSELDRTDLSTLQKPTVIFFDDGFKDVLVNALPILSKYNIPSTVFVTTGLIDRTFMMWTLTLRAFLYRQGSDVITIENKIAEFKKFPMKGREEKLSQLYKEHNFVLDQKIFDCFLTPEDVKTLSQNNIEIGSHGVMHQKLIELSDEVLVKELRDSKHRLEEIIAKPIETISYPYGRHDERVIAHALEAGYKLGMTTVPGYNEGTAAEQFSMRIKRVNGPYPEKSFTEFKVMMYLNF